MILSKCPCGSELFYKECCEPFHLGLAKAPTPLALMKSRYSAYAKGKVDYILKTTHPNHKDRLLSEKKRRSAIENFCKITEFVHLEIRDFQQSETTGFVCFYATLKQGGQDVSFTEKCDFEKIGDQWYYLKGIVN